VRDQPAGLFLEDAVLFDQIGDHAALLAVGPGGEGREEELEVDGVNQLRSISGERQIVALQHVRVFGHYGLYRSLLTHSQIWRKVASW